MSPPPDQRTPEHARRDLRDSLLQAATDTLSDRDRRAMKPDPKTWGKRTGG